MPEKIHTIVVDDEWYSLTEISDMAEKTGIMSVDGRFQNGADALTQSSQIHPQAAFIDIEMPEMDGLTLAEKLLENNPCIKIIFITGWNRYAVAAFELNALDYIMKPVNKDRFNKMAQRLQSELCLEESADQNELSICCFGKFETLKNGVSVVWHRTKAEELFALLSLNANTFLHKNRILNLLWPTYDHVKSLPILQTSVCRIRNVLSDCKKIAHLAFENDQYGLFLCSDVKCDYLTAINAVQSFREDNSQTYEAVKDACTIFQRELLPDSSYSWSGKYEIELQNELADCLRRMAETSPNERAGALQLLSEIIHMKKS